MKTSKKSLIVSIAVLCVCALSLTAASFAWFTTSNTAKIDTINFEVSQRSGLELRGSAANAEWKSTLTTADFLTLPGELNDASTADLTNWFVKNERDEIVAKPGDDNSRYIELSVDIRKAKTGVENETAPTVKFDGTYALKVTTDNKTGLDSALRLGYKNNGATTIVATSNDAQIKGHSSADVIADLTSTASGSAQIVLADNGDNYWQTSVKFYIWVEGTDSACVDGNSGVSVQFKTGFTVA